jgi:hypothetical protein
MPRSQLRHAQNITEICGIDHKNTYATRPNVSKIVRPLCYAKGIRQNERGQNDSLGKNARARL